jgi:hypothetical protein
VLFTRGLRVRDHPALATACEQADLVIPLFVMDAGLMSAAPNQARSCWSPSPRARGLADARQAARAQATPEDLNLTEQRAHSVVHLLGRTGSHDVMDAGSPIRQLNPGSTS